MSNLKPQYQLSCIQNKERGKVDLWSDAPIMLQHYYLETDVKTFDKMPMFMTPQIHSPFMYNFSKHGKHFICSITISRLICHGLTAKILTLRTTLVKLTTCNP
uniref:Uncharacterized protein n=1 Tax=Arundo donax TaxID=35708 RepID=A0A0A8ZF27_ARUDO